jgi:hypothetical protein
LKSKVAPLSGCSRWSFKSLLVYWNGDNVINRGLLRSGGCCEASRDLSGHVWLVLRLVSTDNCSYPSHFSSQPLLPVIKELAQWRL